jgi:quercetin dioxygenase-like cupin family protein
MIRPAAGILAFALMSVVSIASAEDAGNIKPAPTVTELMTASKTILGQPIAYPSGDAQVTAAIIVVPPGGETGWHRHAVPLFGYILEGALTIDYGPEGLRTYRAGDTLMEAMDQPHNGTNRGIVPVRLLAVYMGSTTLPNSSPAAP